MKGVLGVFIVLTMVAVGHSCLYGDTLAADSIRPACNAAQQLEELRAAAKALEKQENHTASIDLSTREGREYKEQSADPQLEQLRNAHSLLKQNYSTLVSVSNFADRFKIRSLAGYAGIFNSLILAALVGVTAWLLMVTSLPNPIVNSEMTATELATLNKTFKNRSALLCALLALWIPARIYTNHFCNSPLRDVLITGPIVMAGAALLLILLVRGVLDINDNFGVQGIFAAATAASATMTGLLVTWPAAVDNLMAITSRMNFLQSATVAVLCLVGFHIVCLSLIIRSD